jgi:hypothetical protein
MNTKKWILVFIFGLISAWLILSFVRILEVLIAFSIIYLAAVIALRSFGSNKN